MLEHLCRYQLYLVQLAALHMHGASWHPIHPWHLRSPEVIRGSLAWSRP